MAEADGDEPEGENHERAEGEIEHGEDPRRGVVKKQTVEPVGNEIPRVGGRAGVETQAALERGEGTGDAEGGLEADQQDHREVGEAEVGAADSHRQCAAPPMRIATKPSTTTAT